MSITIILLALFIGAIGFIIVAARRMQGHRLTGPMFRRAFQYVLLYILVILVSNGAADLLARAVGAPPAFDDAFVLAQAVTAVVIGLPTTILLTWWIVRNQRADPAERESLLYQAYLTAAALTGMIMTAGQLAQILTTALGRQSFDGNAIGHFVSWLLVWAIHWQLIRRTLTGTEAIAHLLLGSTVGLVLGATGLANLLATALDMLTGQQIIVGTYVPLGAAAGLVIAGGLVWVIYWLGGGHQATRGTAWHTYVLLLGVGGGLITALVGAQSLAWRALVTALGDPEVFVNWFDWHEAIGALVVGIMIWWYHRGLLNWHVLTPVRRIYQYIVAGIGVIAAAAGAGLVVVALIDALTPASLFQDPINSLLGGITLLLVSAPVWWTHWRHVQRAAVQHPEIELTAVVRRIYLIVLVGAAAVVVVIALIAAVADLIADGMQGRLGLASLYAVRTEIGYLTAGIVIITYHVAVLRQDAHHTPPPTPVTSPAGTVYLVGPLNPGLVATIRTTYQRPVHFLASNTGETWHADAVLAQLDEHAESGDLLIIAREHGVETQPIDDVRYLQ